MRRVDVVSATQRLVVVPGRVDIDAIEARSMMTGSGDAPPSRYNEYFVMLGQDETVDPSAEPVGDPAPTFVGMSLQEIGHIAGRRNIIVVIVGKDGHRFDWIDNAAVRPELYVMLDATDHVVAARSAFFSP